MTPDDQDFLERFESCTLPDAEFKHTGHVRMAWLYLKAAPLDTAIANICDGIRRFGISRDALQMYHVTVTVAFARIIGSRMKPGETFAAFVETNSDLMSPRPLLLDYYSPERLNSDNARRQFIEPDRKPLP